MTDETEHPAGAEQILAEVAPADGRRKVRAWPIPGSVAPLFVEAYLEAPRRRQEALRSHAIAQACRDAHDLRLDPASQPHPDHELHEQADEDEPDVAAATG